MYKVLIFFLLILSGCNSDSNDDAINIEQKPPSYNVSYENKFIQFSNKLDSAKLELSSLYEKFNDKVSVKSLNNCDFSYNKNVLRVNNKQKSCFFRIGDNPESGILHVLFNNDNMVKYKNGLTQTILVNDSSSKSISIDLSKRLSYLPINLDDFYIKSLSDILVLNDKNIKVNINDKLIELYDGKKGDVIKLAYTLHSKKTDELITGYILVSLSTPKNSLPIAENFELSSKIPSFELLKGIDVASKISDPDGDPLQLIDVFAFNALVEVENKDDPLCVSNSCTTFSFKASSVGYFDVSYVIADHFGGYALGIVRIQTESPSTVTGPWEPILQKKDHLTFTPPLTVEQSNILGFMYQDHFIEKHGSSEYDVSLFNYNMAELYCSLMGLRLPELSEIRQLYVEKGDLSLLLNPEDWSTERQYWTKSSTVAGSHNTFDFKSNTDSFISDEQVAQASCVNDGHLIAFYPDQEKKALPLDGSSVEFELNARLETSDSYPNAGKLVYIFDHSDETNITDSSPVTNSSGVAQAKLQVDHLGSYEVFATYLNDILSTNVEVIAHEIASFIVNPETLTLDRGDPLNNAYDLKAYVTTVADPGTDINVTNTSSWSSSDTSVVTVDPNTGHIQAISVGKATISAEYKYNGVTYSDSSVITVVDNSKKLVSLEIDPYALDIKPYGFAMINSAYAIYSDGSRKEVSSSIFIHSILPTYAGERFSYNGSTKVIIAENSGYLVDIYILKFRYKEDGKTVDDLVKLTIDNGMTFNSLTVTAPSPLNIGATANATAKARFSDGTIDDVTKAASWVSNKPGIVAVNSQGVLSAKSSGTAKITATYTALGKTLSDFANVTVNSAPTDALNSISVTPDTNRLGVGDSKTLTVTGHYAVSGDRVIPNKDVSWSSDHSGIASVSKGNVTAVSVGTTSITAKYNGKQDSATVIVEDNATRIWNANAEISTGCSYDFKGNSWRPAVEGGCRDTDPRFTNVLSRYQPFWGNPVGGVPTAPNGLYDRTTWFVTSKSGPIKTSIVIGKGLRESVMIYCVGFGEGRFTDNFGKNYVINCSPFW